MVHSFGIIVVLVSLPERFDVDVVAVALPPFARLVLCTVSFPGAVHRTSV